MSKKIKQNVLDAEENIDTNKTEQTPSDIIWEEIRNIQISLFALPGKTVEQYCKRVSIEPNKCFLLQSVSSVLPALEEAIGNKYNCELMQKYIVITRK